MAEKDGQVDFNFYGRGDEQSRLRALLTDLLAEPKGDEPGWSHVAILHGLGGIGKTTLLRRRFEPWLRSPAYADKCTLLSVDWETERQRNRTSFPSDQGPSLTTVLDVLRVTADQAGLEKHFKAYGELRDKREEAARKLAMPPKTSSRGDDTADARLVQVIEVVVSLAAKGLGVPDAIPLDRVVRLAQVGVEEARELVSQAHQRMRSSLTPEQYALVTNPDVVYAGAFADCLRAAAAKRPLVITLDTYEIISALGPLLRQIMSRSGVRVAWVLAGRMENTQDLVTDLGAFVSEVQPSERLRSIAVQHFNHSDVRGMLSDAAGLTVTEDDAERLHKATHGIPLAVGAAVTLLREGVPLESILEDSTDPGPRSTLAHKLTRRFLRHLIRGGDPWGDVPRLLSLAVVEQTSDLKLIGAMWGVDDPTPLLNELAARHDFVFTEELRLHDVVREVFRKHTLDPAHRGPVTEPNRSAIALLEQRLAERNDRLPTLEERVEDGRWKTIVSALAWHRFWDDFESGWDTVVAAFPAALAFGYDFSSVLAEHANTFAAGASAGERGRIEVLRELSLWGGSVDEHRWLRGLPRRDATSPEPDDGCPEERAAILAWLRAKGLTEGKRYQVALESLREAARSLPAPSVHLRQLLAESLDTVAGALAWQQELPPPVAAAVRLDAARLAATLLPDDVRMLRTLSYALETVHRHEEMAAVCDRIAELEPADPNSHAERSRAHHLFNSFDTALAAAEEAVRLAPANPVGHVRRSVVLTAMQHHDEAIAAIDHAIGLEPSNSEWHGIRSDALACAHRNRDALDAAATAIDLGPSRVDPHYYRAIALARLARYDEALSTIGHAIQLDPADSRLHAWRSAVLLWAAKPDDALTAAQEAVKFDPLSPHNHRVLCEVLRELRRYDEALTAADHAVALDPTDSIGYRRRSAVLIALDRAGEALSAADEAIRLSGTTVDNHLCRSEALSALKRHDEALTAVDRGLVLNPTDLDARNRKIDRLIESRCMAEAVRLAEDVLRGDREDTHRWSYLGHTLLWSERFDDALSAYDEAIALMPRFAVHFRDRGRVLIFTERYTDALAAFDRAVELEPHNTNHLSWRADLLIDLGDLDRALADCDETIRLRPEIPSHHYRRGRLLRRLGDDPGRRRAWRRAAELTVGELESSLYLGEIALEDGDLGAAETHLSRTAEADTEDRPSTWLAIAALAWHRGDEELAEQGFQRALSAPFTAWDDRTAFQKAMHAAIALLCLGRADEALERVRSATRLPGDREDHQVFDLLEASPTPPARLAELRDLCR